MAKSPKDQTDDKSVDQDEIEDAEIVEEPNQEDPKADEPSSDDANLEDVEPSSNDDGGVVADNEDVEDASDDQPNEQEAESETALLLPVEQPQQKPSAIPLIFGGVVAGAIGFAVATFTTMDSSATDVLSERIDAQAEQIAALSEVEAAAPPDLSPLENRVSDVAQQIANLEASLGSEIADMGDRIEALEKRPNADGTLSDEAIAAYQAELDALREEVMAAAIQAEADLAEARAEAEQLEQDAIAAAEAAQVRAALNRVSAALETGAPFADALMDLPGEVPPALASSAETGVATNAQLTSDFPVVARAALATARAEGLSDDASGLGGFLRSQFDVRSTAPREGSDPDAILSRAEDAVKNGRIADALAELEGLPEVARAEMTEWLAAAQARSDALTDIAQLSETVNDQ
ncbi:MAG: hypothetical protein AAGL89_10950 [Pseudomonadota bacterium]